MMDIATTLGLLCIAGLLGMFAGRTARRTAPYICEIMLGYESESRYLAKLRSRISRGTELLRRFRERSIGLGDQRKKLEKKIEAARQIKIGIEREITLLKNRPQSVWRMLGDERIGGRCYAAEIVNPSAAKQDQKGFNARDWRGPVVVLVWADGRGDARAKMEGAYPHSEGFHIGRIYEFDGDEEISL